MAIMVNFQIASFSRSSVLVLSLLFLLHICSLVSKFIGFVNNSQFQVLNTYKKKLNNLTMESNRLKLEISQRNELLTKIGKKTILLNLV